MARSGSLAVLLELFALASLPVAIVLTVNFSAAAGVLSLGLGSGTGWMRSGYVSRGLWIGFVRAMTAPLAFLLLASLRRTAVCAGPECSVGSTSPAVVILFASAVIVTYAVIPLVSAVVLSLVVAPAWRR
jgi:alkylation response protein AidB-like acyl-CoA dehydrogenase